MPIEARCSHCGKQLRVRDELAGGSLRCPGCRREIVVAARAPGVRPPPPPPPPRAAPRGDEDLDDLPRRRSPAPGPPLLVIALVAGGVVLAVGLVVAGFVAFRISGGTGAAGAPGAGGAVTTGTGQPGPAADGPLLIPIEGKALDVNNLLVGADGKEVVALRGSLLFGGKARPTVTRYDIATRSRAGSAALDVKDLWGPYAISPDGSVMAISRAPVGLGGLDLVLVRVADGKVIRGDWRPSYARGGPGTKPRNYSARQAFALDATRWLTVYADDAVALWTVTAAGGDFRMLREGAAAPQMPGGQAAITADRKTLALWEGGGFTLLDAEMGRERSKTAPLTVEPGQRLECWKAHLSPGGKYMVAELVRFEGRKEERFLASWGTVEGGFATTFPGEERARPARWWGERHMIAFGSKEPFVHGYLLNVVSGKVLCKINLKAQIIPAQSEDGRLWFVASRKPDGTDAHIVGMPFPEEAVRQLGGRVEGPFDVLPVMEIGIDGVAIK